MFIAALFVIAMNWMQFKGGKKHLFDKCARISGYLCRKILNLTHTS